MTTASAAVIGMPSGPTLDSGCLEKNTTHAHKRGPQRNQPREETDEQEQANDARQRNHDQNRQPEFTLIAKVGGALNDKKGTARRS